MAFIRDEILKAWDKAVARIAQNHEDLTDDELEGVVAAVCAKLPGVARDDITERVPAWSARRPTRSWRSSMRRSRRSESSPDANRAHRSSATAGLLRGQGERGLVITVSGC